MYLKAVYVRFYKSFNFEYLRKYQGQAEKREWEMIDTMWYPYVRIPIDRGITTVVGENESGKTHLLTAIEKGLDGEDIELKDFCRYSQFFTVEQDKRRLPDFGFEWEGLSEEESLTIATACKLEPSAQRKSFLLFRTEGQKLTAYFPGSDMKGKSIAKKDHAKVLGALPSVFRLYAKIALPETVPISSLISKQSSAGTFDQLSRERRTDLLESLMDWQSAWFSTLETITKNAPEIQGTISKFSASSDEQTVLKQQELQLARDLILKIARIDVEALKDLQRALRQGDDAFANSLIQKINEALDERLNFPKWWAQDSEFELKVTARDYDLTFTISDRTKKEYSFGERSSGLRFFLSYYIQYRSHEPVDDRPEILLMDEPDAYLSSQGQQDLLKIFEAFAYPAADAKPTQVIYVTHSPFLIDKNHAERIRVLQKGEGDEGTRVVRDASRNHYEPLRSSFGSFVAETTFIGNCNLMTEGVADQVLLAGFSVYLRSLKGVSDLETLDLNHLTIVPASGASHVPYLVYLARGRDIEQPAVIVLLDSDKDGDDAKKGILRGGPKCNQLLKEELILQVGDLAGRITLAEGSPLLETEDLIPLRIGAMAASRYLTDVCGIGEENSITENMVSKQLKNAKSTFKAIQACAGALDGNPHIEKIGFARSVLDVVGSIAADEESAGESKRALRDFESNMRILFQRLNSMKREALREHTVDKVSQRVNRAKKAFLRDHRKEANRSDVFVLLEEIGTVLKDTRESDAIKIEMSGLRRDFKIDKDLTELVDRYDEFRDRLERLSYAGLLAVQEPDEESRVSHRERESQSELASKDGARHR